MRKTFNIFILISIAFIVFLTPVLSYAQEQKILTPSQIDVKYGYPWAGTTNPADFVARFYKIALGIVGGAALGVLVYGAILWTVSGAVSTKQDAIEWIWAAIWGIVLLLSAYLILNTINPDLVNLKNPASLINLTSASVDVSKYANSSGIASAPYNEIYEGGSFGGGGATRSFESEVLNEDQARNQLSSVGIGVKNTCSSGQSSGCVNLNGILQPTLNEVGILAAGIGSNNVFVTAGTEGCGTVHSVGTYSHCNGYKIDLRLNTNLNNYITQNFKKISDRTTDGATQYVAPSGAVYALESDHWDVLVKKT